MFCNFFTIFVITKLYNFYLFGQSIWISMQNLESVAQKMAELYHNYVIIISMGTSENDQVSQNCETWSDRRKLGHNCDQVFTFMTKFSTIFWKYMIQSSYQKSLGSKLVFHSNSFLCKRMCLYLQKSSDSEMLCDQKKLGRYHDQVSIFLEKWSW